MSIKRKIIGRLNEYVKRSYWYNEKIFKDCQKFWNLKCFNYQLVNLGSGSAKFGFDYSNIKDIQAANWAMEAQTFIGDKAILSNYLSYLNEEKATVIITLCPFSCLGECNTYLPDKFYTLVSTMSIPDFAVERKSQILRIKTKPLNYIPAVELFSEIRRKSKAASQTLTAEQLQKSAERCIEGWKSQFSITDLQNDFSLVNKDRFELSEEAFEALIQECLTHNLTPVVVLPPVSKYVQNYFDDNFKQRYIYDFVNKAKTKDFVFLDYLNDKEFQDDKYYRSAIFLNEEGAKKFTQEVINELKIRNLLM